jgi:hypothetical protein
MALRELHRILRPKGQAVLMIPIVEGWSATYEDSTRTTTADRHLHFGQWDHVRYYGADFRDRVRAAGFELSEFCGSGKDTVTFRLQPGERVFLATRR